MICRLSCVRLSKKLSNFRTTCYNTFNLFAKKEIKITMTRRELEITDISEILHIMDTAKILHLGLSDDGWPYVVPMNYGYTYKDNHMTLYLHGATKGYKFEVIEKNPNASFAIETDTIPFEGRIACQYGMAYKSVMGRGRASLVEKREEKETALSLLMKQQTGKDFTFDEKLVSIVNVIRIDVNEFTAKERKLPAAIRGEE